jgi:signal transduction histidine kinase
VAYLTALVENLHQAARLRHGLDAREGEADLREVVLRSEIRFRALGQASGVEVAAAVPEKPVWVRCSPVLAERVVANLLQNAMSHGARHAAVQLMASASSFQLVVLDDGPGVARPADLALRTFEISPDRPRSTGLGLAITNEIARRAGWTVHYASEGGLRVELSGSLAGEDGA